MPADTIPVRKGRKMPQVLEGARTIFLRDGFEGASVDDIAREAGVSKATLYSYFPDKRLLFLEVAKAECLRQAEETVALISADLGPRAVLTLAATRIVAFVLSDFGIRTYRICVAEADRFPELGHEFYQSGPALVRQRIVDYLTSAVSRNELVIGDLDLAADQFAELCKADLFNRIVFGVGEKVGEDERRRVAEGAVEMFLARYAPQP
ncbi:TetR/AcrR family transcriptional regulator [Rhodobacter sp. NSM]|uniref:TetR/AcrR family transcriptional regulator n=1 Tax=Rhodobacter sp. NSM TaxID=3457501 RepID=UPI003FD612CE